MYQDYVKKYAINELLDATGLRCPLPLLKAKQRLNGMQEGQRLLVAATDEHAVEDFTRYTELTSYILVLSESIGEKFIFVIEKSE